MRTETEYKALEIMLYTQKKCVDSLSAYINKLQDNKDNWKKLPLWKRILKRD